MMYRLQRVVGKGCLACHLGPFYPVLPKCEAVKGLWQCLSLDLRKGKVHQCIPRCHEMSGDVKMMHHLQCTSVPRVLEPLESLRVDRTRKTGPHAPRIEQSLPGAQEG